MIEFRPEPAARPSVRRVLAGLLVGGCMWATGCGGDGHESGSDQKIRGLMNRFEQLSRKGDGRTICKSLFTPKLAESVTRAAPDNSCPREVRRNVHTPNAVVRVRSVEMIDERNAVARVTVQRGVRNAVYVVKTPADQWRIRSIRQDP